MAPISLGSSTTAIEALQGADLAGKTAVVTGGNSGIGTETARALSLAGARVIITSRNLEAGQRVADELNSTAPKGQVHVQQLDLADLSSVEKLAKHLNLEPQIDLLILNAGVMMCPEDVTKNNFEMQVGTNHFGHFQLTRLLLEKLTQQAYIMLKRLSPPISGHIQHHEKLQVKFLAWDTPVRVVVVSSAGHQFGGLDLHDMHFRRRSYGKIKAYGQSKMCNILFAKELARRTKQTSMEVFSLHPGSIMTNLGRHLGMMQNLGFLLKPFLKNAQQGAATSVYAATSPQLVGKSGAYLQDCKIAQPNAQAQDAELAKKLWTVTEQQIDEALARIQ